MGLFDFLFGSKPTTSDAPQQQTNLAIEPFVFKSNCHQRFESGNPVMGLQQCVRTVTVEKNTNGCSGYKLNPGIGYIVKIYNNDLNKPNMSDKPMTLVSKTAEKAELRGFKIEAKSPFGWQEVDYSTYGLTVTYSNGKVSKCILHMFDRNVDIEYRLSDSQSELNDKIDCSKPVSIKNICNGASFSFLFRKTIIQKCYYSGSQTVVAEYDSEANGNMTKWERDSPSGTVSITLTEQSKLSQLGITNSRFTFKTAFLYQSPNSGIELASAQLNNSGRGLSLAQITKQNNETIAFIIYNLPNVDDYYYLIMFRGIS